MAFKPYSILAFVVILNIVFLLASAVRDMPKDVDRKQPETFTQEGSVLIPGIGRTNTGHGVSIPTLPAPTTGGSVPGYVPGDNTPVPSPGFEVPTGALPSPPARH
ncbi:hypothetical protein POM88_018142 [Heracleum sosnowskyi]|uniref:Uncharacterized protein n=1 Tax=Heracleum sosnowskyi TaxID=360622 RepID=A0AAD8IPY9_9APIA|nr:hypothetical protein POM88_018142 [Heracleum sosnowskyi]